MGLLQVGIYDSQPMFGRALLKLSAPTYDVLRLRGRRHIG